MYPDFRTKEAKQILADEIQARQQFIDKFGIDISAKLQYQRVNDDIEVDIDIEDSVESEKEEEELKEV